MADGVSSLSASRIDGSDDPCRSQEISETLRTFTPLTSAEQEFLLRLARRTLEAYVDTRTAPPAHLPPGLSLSDHRGVFVTLYSKGKLRGCVGCHRSDDPLYRTVQNMAVSSGFRDPRFPPLRRNELGHVTLEISAYLTTVVSIGSAEEFVVGRHGIIMRIGGLAATFLPKVAVQQGWNRVQTLERLCLKAGLSSDAWRSPEARFSVYETQVFSE